MPTLAPELAREYRARGWWGDRTLHDLFADNVARHPERLALVDAPNRAEFMHGAPRRLAYAALALEVDRLAAGLVAHGVRQGSLAVLQLPNCVEAVVALLALARIGAIASPVPVQYREHELGFVLAQAAAQAVITTTVIEGHAHAAMALAQRPGLPQPVTVFAFGETVPEGAIALDALPADGGPRPALDAYLAGLRCTADDTFTVGWTSGTESRPKGVVRSHNQWLVLMPACIDAARLEDGAVLLNPFPMANLAAFVGFVVPWLGTAGTLLLHHPFSLPTFIGQLGSGRIDFTAAPPALLNLMLLRPEMVAGIDFGRIGAIGAGGAPLAPSMVQSFQDRYGVAVINLFGSTEGGSLVSGPEDIADPAERAQYFPRWGVAGLHWPARMAERVTTRLVDLRTGEEIREPGRAGELRFRGPGVFREYYRAPELTAAAFDEQGYYRSGDLFEIAGDRGQYYRYVGRSKELIIRGGVNIAPEEIEGLLAGHPDVAEVAVIGYPDAVMGEKICAVLVPRGPRQPGIDELRDYLCGQRQAARFKAPERVVWLDRLPRNAMGKVVKRELRERLGSSAEGDR